MSSSLITTLARIQYEITLWIYPLWLIFGIIGCLLNLIVFSRPSLRKTSCSICKLSFFCNNEYSSSCFQDFFAASVDHLLTLLVGVVPIVYSLNHPNPQIQSLIFCKIRGYLFQITLMLSRWYVAFACIDRYALTSNKVRLRNFANNKFAYRIIVIVVLVWCIICSHRLIFYEIKGNLCGIVNNTIAALYQSAYVIIGGGILPVLIMIICACLIRKNLFEKKERRAEHVRSYAQRQQQTIDNQILRILLIQIICYIIFILPQMSYVVFNGISLTMLKQSSEHLAIEQFVLFIAECVLYMFPVTSFYLYTLTSKTFRKELLKYFYSVFDIFFGRQRVSPSMNDATTRLQRLSYTLNKKRFIICSFLASFSFVIIVLYE